MDKELLEKKADTTVKSTEILDELCKLYDQAVTDQDFQLCEIVRLEIKRCLMKQPLLIPSGQVDGLILDPLAVLLGK